jgi:hypothetical protein
VAIQGYDPVAYFKQGKALKGRKELQRMKSVVYYFSMPGNKVFLKESFKFEPSMEVGVLCNGRL